MENLAGQEVKGYELQEKIEGGGQGDIYRAYQSSVGREVVVKVIKRELANQPDFIRRFETEAQLIARLEHPFIVPLHDYWREPDGAYLVMRYLRGGSLHDHLRQNGACSIEEALSIFSQVAQALHVAHCKQVIHRDIKPGNILLDEDGNAYLADFGIAKDHTTNQNITEPNAFIGSPEYLAPEQARSEPVTPRTDIYSMGVVLYEMLTGEHPFPNLQKIEVIFKHLNELLPEISSLDDSICNDINRVIQKATAKDPSRRFNDILEMLQALRDAAKLDSVATPTSLVELLTPREQEVMQLIIDGKTNQEIADILVLTKGTVRQYNNNIYRKLKVRSRMQAIVRARDLNFLIQKPETYTSMSTGYLPEPVNPYKGLEAFRAADAQDYFGREKLIQKLLYRLQQTDEQNRFLALVGPSGSGKSSLAKAGLIPALWRGDLPDSENWYLVDMLPGTHPIDKLESALLRIATDKSINLREQLARDERGLIRVADIILPDDDEDAELLIVIDQFEEVFTLVEKEAERLHFLNLILAAVNDERSKIRVVVTLRADYYDRPLQYPDLGELMRTRVETVLPLNAEELERAINSPATRAGVTFEDGLVSRIVSDVHYQPGALPLLQYALTELFERRDGRKLTLEAYEAIGGTGGALAKRADEIYLEGNDEGRELVRQLFLRLVTLGEGAEDTRRRVNRAELLEIAQVGTSNGMSEKGRRGDSQSVEVPLPLGEGFRVRAEMMDEIIDLYANSRLLSLDNDPATRQPTVEVAHEAILREWDRLREWLNQSRDDIKKERNLSQKANEWLLRECDTALLLRGNILKDFEDWQAQTELALTPLEQRFIAESIKQRETENRAKTERIEREKAQEKRSQTLLRALVAIFALAAIIATGLSIFAFDQWGQVRLERDISRELALVNGARAAFVDGDLDTALTLAVAANQGENPSAMAQTILSQAAYAPGTIRRFGQDYNWAFSIDISPDGKTAFTGGMEDGTVILWDIGTGERIFTMHGHELQAWDVGISPDGTMGYSMGGDGIVLWDLQTGEMLRRFGEDMLYSEFFLGAAFTPDGQALLSNNGAIPPIYPSQEANLILWDVETGEVLRTFRGHTQIVGRPAISPDGTMALTSAWSRIGNLKEFILWDMETGEIIRQREELNPAGSRIAMDIAFIPDKYEALILFHDSTAALIDLNTLETIQTYGEPEAGAFTFSEFALSPDYQTLYLYNIAQKEQGLWDVNTGKQLMSMDMLNAGTFGAGFLPDGSSFLVSDKNDVIRQISVQIGAEIHHWSFSGHFGWQYDVSPDGQNLLVNAGSQEACQYILYDIATNTEIQRFGMDDTPLNEIGCKDFGVFAFMPDGQSVLSQASDGPGILWDLQTGEILLRLPVFPTQVEAGRHERMIGIHPDGQSAITPNDVGTELLQWDLTTGDVLQRFPLNVPEYMLSEVALSPDGNTAVTVLSDRINCWDLTTGEMTCELIPPTGFFTRALFKPDGQQLVTYVSGTLTGSDIVTWNLTTQEIISSFSTDNREMDITPDGHYAVLSDPNVSIWDLSTGEEIRRYPFNIDVSSRPMVLPDGNSFFIKTVDALGVGGPALYQLRIDTHEELMQWTLNNRYIRDLTCTERELYSIKPLCEGES